MRFILTAALAIALAACGDSHHYHYPPETPQEAPQEPPAPTPAPEPTPPIATPPTPPAETVYTQHWFGTIPYQVAQATRACRVTVTAPTPVTTEVSLHDCQPGTAARVIISTQSAGSFEKTIRANDSLTYTLHHPSVKVATVFAILRDGFEFPAGGAAMVEQGEIKWFLMLRSNDQN
jgi:hypothetical protein